MVATIQHELAAFQHSLQDVPQLFGAFVPLLFCFGHVRTSITQEPRWNESNGALADCLIQLITISPFQEWHLRLFQACMRLIPKDWHPVLPL